jgi:hypothetical protein
MSSSTSKRALSVRDFLHSYSIGQTKFYEEVRDGRLRVVKLGKKTLVDIDEAERWFASLADRVSA